MSQPKTQDSRYPVVAIPKCIYFALNVAIRKNPFSTLSVNLVVQELINQVDIAFIRGSGICMHVVKSYKVEPRFDVGEVKQIRVTAAQFNLLRQVQSEYYKLGLRVSIASILAAVLSRLDTRCLNALKKRWTTPVKGSTTSDEHVYKLLKRGQDGLILVEWPN